MPAPWVRTYIKLTEFLGQLLGPDYEVVLHDVQSSENSVIAIANGHISGRTIGAPLTSAALQAIASGDHETQDFRSNYTGIAANGKLLRSSTFYIKDGEGKLVGLLCINFDDSRYRELSSNILRLCHPDAFVSNNFVFSQTKLDAATQAAGSHESFQSSLSELTDDVFNQALKQRGKEAHQLSKRERADLIEELHAKGYFLLKGAIKQVADAMGCSQTTIYRHLNRLDQADNQTN